MAFISDPSTRRPDQLDENQQALLAESLDLGAPLALASVVAAWLSSLEPAAQRAPGSGRRRRETRKYVSSALATPGAPVTAALHLIAAMACDDDLRACAADEANRRTDELPLWIHRLPEVTLTTPVESVSDPERATATVVVGATIPVVDDATGAINPGPLDGPPPATLDSFSMIVTSDTSTSPPVPIELLLTPYAPAGLAARLACMDGPSSTVRALSNADAKNTLRNVLDGPHRGVALEEVSTSALPLVRWLARTIGV